MDRRVPNYVIVRDMVHIRNDDNGHSLCGLSLEGIVDEPKRATHGFCLTCQEKQQLPGLEAPLIL